MARVGPDPASSFVAIASHAAIAGSMSVPNSRKESQDSVLILGWESEDTAAADTVGPATEASPGVDTAGSIKASAIGDAEAEDVTRGQANSSAKAKLSDWHMGLGKGRNLMHVDGHRSDIALAYCYVTDAMEGR